jgi:hypothetical protein
MSAKQRAEGEALRLKYSRVFGCPVMCVAVRRRTGAEVIEQHDIDGLDPGIRQLVIYLDGHGFETCDSGDGVSKVGAMECAEAESHVYMIVTPTTMVAEAHRLEALLAAGGIDAPELRIECSYSPNDMTALLSLHGVRDSDLPFTSPDRGSK